MEHPVELITIDDYWKNAISVCEAALQMLKLFEGKDYVLVDAVTHPLRQLIGRGRDFTAMKNYSGPPPSEITSAPSRKLKKISDLGFDPRANWTIEDDHTVLVHLTSSNVVTCKLVTTVEQLEEALKVIQESKCLALDCEFLGLKKHVPELKVLQIAVTDALGFAILVDEIGVEEAKKRIAPVLQAKDKLLLGWAFGGDAQAIETAFRGIQLPPVLDLQFKIKSIAVEQMKLSNAMNKYASDWVGLQDFSKAKQLGDSFQFLGPDCVWLKNPLPPEALVYSVFDVVSLIALHEKTREYPTAEQHYWPKTIISTFSRKALDKWYRNRAYNMLPSGQEFINIIGSGSSSSSVSPPAKSGREKQPSTASTNEYADDDPQYQADLEEAIRRSQEDFVNQKREERIVSTIEDQPEASSSKTKPSPTSEPSELSEPSSSPSSSNTAVQQSTVHDRPKVAGKQKYKVVEEETTIFSDLAEAQPADGKEFHFAEDIYDNTRDSNSNKHGVQDVEPGTWDEVEVAANTRKEWDVSDEAETKASITPQTSSQNVLQQAYYRHTEGAFAWDTPAEGQMDDESWRNFVDSSEQRWKRGEDTKLDWEEMEKKRTSKSKRESNPEIVRFNTTPMPAVTMHWGQSNAPEDDWDKQDVRPNTMIMPMKNVPKIKSKMRGPRVVNPFIDNLDEDDDEDGNASEGSEESDKDQPGSKEQTTTKADVETKESDALVDDLYLNDGKIIHMYLITRSDQIYDIGRNVMWEEPRNVTVAITFHIQKAGMDRSNNARLILKALQLYIANTGESFTIVVPNVFDAKKVIRGSMLEKLLTDPEIVRVTWGLEYVLKDIEEQFDLKVGPLHDPCIACSGLENRTFAQTMQRYCSDSPNLEMYQEARNEVLDIEKRKFSSTIWDRERVSELAVRYSSLQGWVLHRAFKKMIADPAGYEKGDLYWVAYENDRDSVASQ